MLEHDLNEAPFCLPYPNLDMSCEAVFTFFATPVLSSYPNAISRLLHASFANNQRLLFDLPIATPPQKAVNNRSKSNYEQRDNELRL